KGRRPRCVTEPRAGPSDEDAERARAPESVPIGDVAQRRTDGPVAVRSHNAGAYLCNALLFDLLARKSTGTDSPGLFVFVHVPAALVDPEPGGLPHRLNWQSALDGGLTIANFIVDWHEQHQRPAFTAAPFIGG
ncbi:MAG: hypothetical protein AAFR55_09755, partial [Pseudomonadota bacterium]